jgi:hypothetical protein
MDLLTAMKVRYDRDEDQYPKDHLYKSVAILIHICWQYRRHEYRQYRWNHQHEALVSQQSE